MFERYTESAKTLLRRASLEADTLSCRVIGTEHLLLALAASEHEIVAAVFRSVDVSYEQVNDGLRNFVGSTPLHVDVPSRGSGFTPRARLMLEEAFRQALQLRSTEVQAEHVLLGLATRGEHTDSGAGIAGLLLCRLGVSCRQLRQTTLTEIAHRAVARQ